MLTVSKNCSNNLLVLLFLVGLTTAGNSQDILGRVLTSDGSPIPMATVKAYPMAKYTISDSQGNFTISVLDGAPLTYLECSHVGFETKRITVSEQADLSNIIITLSEQVTKLDEVVMLQSRILQKVVNQSQSVIILDKDFMERNNTGTFSGALSSLPGINTMNVGVGIGKPVIRGMGFNRVLVNNKGIKQEGQQWGADHGLEIDPFNVENVEIIKGPASLLFGSDGLGGVINIAENEVLPTNGNTLEYRAMYQTNNGAISNSLAFKNRKDKWYYSARATHQDYGDYRVPSDEFTYAGFNLPIFDNRLKNTAGEEFHVSGGLGYVSENFRSSLSLSSFNQKAGIFTGAIGLPRAYNLQHNGDFRNIDIPRQENHHHAITSNSTLQLGKDRLELDLGFQRNIREELSFPGAHGISPELAGTNLALGLYLNTYTANLRYELNLNNEHKLWFGSQWQAMQNQRDGFEFLLPVFNSYQLGFFHYQSLDISPKLAMNAGIRFDLATHAIEQHLQPIFDRGTLLPTGDFEERTPAFDRNFENFSAALGLVYKANRENHLKLNLGNSFRFPTAIELSSNGVHHGNFRHELGNRNLGMERGYQSDLTWLHQSKKLFVEVAAFYGYFTDFIYLSPTGNFSPLASGGTLWQYRQDDAIFNGFEITASYPILQNLKIDLGADVVQNLNLNSRLPLPLTPPPSVTSTLEYNWSALFKNIDDAHIFISSRYNFQQNRTDRNERETPDSFILNAGLGFSVKAFSNPIQFNINANNILNVAYFNHISRYRLLNLPEQGRNISLSVRMPITF